MCKWKSNATFNNNLFMPRTIARMHQTMTRLYLAAKELRGITGQSELARALNKSPQTVNNWEARGVSKQGMLEAERKIGCSAVWIGTGQGEMKASARSNTEPGPSLHGSVPLISWIQAGAWSDVIDNLAPGEGERIATTYHARPHTYALRVKGDSMEPRFPNGSILIVEPDENPEPGKFVIVRQNGGTEAVFKQLVQDGGTLYLKPLNDRYPILQLRPDAVFCGVVKRMEMDV